MRHLSRRSIVTGAAAAIPAAVGAPSVLAASTALSDDFTDLAARLAALYPLWRDRKNAEHADLVSFWDQIEEETGFDCNNHPSINAPGGKEFAAVCDRILAERRTRRDPEPLDKDGGRTFWDEMHDELFPLVKEILSLQARSLNDLALQARALALIVDEWWTSTFADVGDIYARMLVENLCGLAGVEPLPGINHVLPIKWEEDNPAA